MSTPNLTYLLSDALATEWMMTVDACHALKQIYLDALNQKKAGSLRISDIESLWAKHESEGLGEAMHMLREEDGRMAIRTEPRKDTNYTQTYKNIAIIDIIGPIVPRVRGMSSGSVGAQQIRNDFISAFESEDIKGILLNVDSPGGDARGISELAQTIQRARDKNTKPIYAYAAGWMASAAYFISAASHRIVANDWASVGSIGVVIGVPPQTADDNIEFVSTVSPYKRPDHSTDEGKKIYQDKADYMGRLFIEAVAELRGVTTEKVISDFGKGGTLVGKQAKSAGLVDGIGTFDSTLRALITSKPLAQLDAGSDANAGTPIISPEVLAKDFGGLGAMLIYQKAVESGLADRIRSCESVLSETQPGEASSVRASARPTTRASISDGGKTMSTNKDDAKTSAGESRWDRFTAWLDGEKASAKGDESAPAGVNIYTMPPPAAGTLASIKQPHAFLGDPAGACTAPDCGEKSDHAAHEESAEVKELRAKAALADKYAEQIKAARKEAAEAFAGSLVLAHVLLPAGMSKVTVPYIQAAEDDEKSPLATGSRVESFKASFDGLPKHNLTSEFITADMPAGALALNPDPGTMEESLAAADKSAREYAARNNPKPNLSAVN